MKKILHLPLLLFLCSLAAFGQNVAKNQVDAYAAKTGAIPSIDNATGSLSFLRFPAAKPLSVSGSGAREKSFNFISQNSALFGITSGNDLFSFSKLEKDNIGLEHVTLQQTYKGIPVFDGIMKFHYTKDGKLASVNGNFISGIKLSVKPTITSEEASQIAINTVEGQKSPASKVPLRAAGSKLIVFQKGLVQGYQGQKHLVYEIEVGNGADVREFLFIDAHNRIVVEQFTGIHSIERELYEPTYLPDNLVWKEGNAFPGMLDTWKQSELLSAGHIYHMMKNAFGRVSYNGADAKMITTHNNPQVACPNASWNGVSANYCDGTASDDMVAHEWGHAYTQFTSGLIYSFQSGALNESYSDIWGETVDQLNGYQDDGENPAPRTPECGSTSRWMIAEASPAFGGAIRDMYNPTCFGDPGKVSDLEYHCSLLDGGGVHHNSGVNNHAYALLVDGGTYNGQTITGIGLTKAAHIFWRAQTSYLTPTSDFYAQADALQAAANDLLIAGTNLFALSTADGTPTFSGQTITAGDFAELAKVLLAVEMRNDAPCPFPKIFAAAPPLCTGATTSGVIFLENFEDGLAGWTASSIPTDATNFTARNWTAVASKRGRTGVAYASDPNTGDCSGATFSETGLLRLQSPAIAIPPGTTGDILMSFDHYIATEWGYDGGNIKFSIDGGAWTLLPSSAFTANGYNITMSTPTDGNSSPLNSQPGFSGYDTPSILGSWGQSQINLSADGIGLTAGQTISLRWEFGSDICTGNDGWYIDDVRIYSCAVPAVHFASASSSVSESEATVDNSCLDYVERTIAVNIGKAPSQPVTVTFSAGGTAKQGVNGDYTLSPSSVVLSSGNLTQNVTVRIYNDAYVEGNETITLAYNLSTGGGDAFAGLINQSHTIVITDNDATPANDAVVPVYLENFNNGKAGWTTFNGGNSLESWQIKANYYDNYFDDGSPFIIADSRSIGTSAPELDETIESPVINTKGMKGLTLKFKQIFKVNYSTAFVEQGITEIWNGNAWITVNVESQNTGDRGWWTNPHFVTVPIPDAYANENMKVRFRYIGKSDFFWIVDDVTITRTSSNEIQSEVNAGSSEYLGPNETAYFYGTSGNLIAKIENLTAHDYGCTTVEVDRAGAGKTAWVGTYNITNKTFKVTPTNANPSGSYTITLYYTAEELAGFSGSDIKSMGKSAGSIGAGNTLLTSFAALNVTSVYSTDFAYSATFNSGFSGFGLSDANPADGPLPVRLTRFEGKNTVEGNLLTWTTATEFNSDYFAVEQAANGKTFKEIGRIESSGNSSVTNDYNFLDASYPQGISYYRLKQVDKDGTFAYSKIVAIDALNARQLKFFPNPVLSQFTMELPDASLNSVDVRVINVSGQEIMTKKAVKTSKGNITMELGKLPTGIYQVIVTSDRASYNMSVLKL